MKTRIALISLAALLPATVLAGYDEAKKAFDGYAPPAWLTQSPEVAAQPAKAPAAPVVLEDSSKIVAPEFFTPDSAKTGELAIIAGDASRVAALLAERLALPEVEILALARNPEIAAAKAEVAARRVGFSIAASLSETLRAYEAYTSSSMGEVGGLMKEPSGYPYPGVATLRGAVIKADVAQGEEKVEEAKARVLAKARAAFHELSYLVGALAIEERRLDLLGTLVSVAETRYSTGQGMLSEVPMLKSEIEKSREMLVTLAGERGMRESALLSLLALAQSSKLAAPSLFDGAVEIPALPELLALARERNQAYRAMKSDTLRMESMVTMGEAMSFGRPGDTTTALEVNPTALSASSSGMGGAAGASLAPTAAQGVANPKGATFSAGADYQLQTKRRLAAAQKALEGEANALDAMVYEAWFKFDKASREEALYRDRVSEYAKLAFEINSSAYRNGAAEFTQVFASYREWLDAALAAEKSRSEKLAALAELETLVGVSPLGTNKLNAGEK